MPRIQLTLSFTEETFKFLKGLPKGDASRYAENAIRTTRGKDLLPTIISEGDDEDKYGKDFKPFEKKIQFLKSKSRHLFKVYSFKKKVAIWYNRLDKSPIDYPACVEFLGRLGLEAVVYEQEFPDLAKGYVDYVVSYMNKLEEKFHASKLTNSQDVHDQYEKLIEDYQE